MLAGLLKRHHGTTPVILHILRTRQKIQMNESFFLNFTEVAESELKKLLGEACVLLKPHK